MFSRPIRTSFHHLLQIILLAFRVWQAQIKIGGPVSELDYLGLL